MQQLLLVLIFGFIAGAVALWGAYYFKRWPFGAHQLALAQVQQEKDTVADLRKQLRQVSMRVGELKRERDLVLDDKRQINAKLAHARTDTHELQQQLGDAIRQNEEMQMQLARAVGQTNELQHQLATADVQEELFQKQLIELSLANDKLRRQLHRSFHHNDSLMIKLTDFAGRADGLNNQLIEVRKHNAELQSQLDEAQRLMVQLAKLEEENVVLSAKMEGAENLDLPDRFAEVIENLSQTKHVIQSAMLAFSTLQNQTISIEMLSDGLLIGSSAMEVNELAAQQQQLEAKLAKTNRLLADVWSKYRAALNRLHRLSLLENENQDLYLRLRVSDTKVSILKDKLHDVARREVDDLQRVPGVTAEYERRLRMAGIDTFEHLSMLKPSQLRRIVKAEDASLNYRNWIRNAKRLASQMVYVPAWLTPRLIGPGRGKRMQPVTPPQFGQYLERRLSEALADDNKMN